MQNIDLFQLAASGAIVHILEWAKGPNGPGWIRGDTTQLNKWLSWLAAILFGLGITITGNYEAGWQIGIPPMHSMWDSLARIVVSRMQQEAYYSITKGQVKVSVRTPEPAKGLGDVA